MSTSSPTDIPQPAEPSEPTGPVEGGTATIASTETISIGQVEEGDKPAAPVWKPRPHDQLSPEDKDLDDLTDDELEALTAAGTSTGVLGGAAAIISGALGLASITGTWLGSMINEREKLIGGINANGKSPAVQLSEGYTTPWHQMAEFNGLFALIAVLVGAGTLFAGAFLSAKPLPNWVKAVAWAGLALGVIGLFVSSAMYFDWFVNTIKIPASTSTGSSTGG